jgi:uncharacterized membrane protein
MKKLGEFVVSASIGGLLVVVPLYLTILLLLKTMQSVVGFVRPFAMCSRSGSPLSAFSPFSCAELLVALDPVLSPTPQPFLFRCDILDQGPMG